MFLLYSDAFQVSNQYKIYVSHIAKSLIQSAARTRFVQLQWPDQPVGYCPLHGKSHCVLDMVFPSASAAATV